MKKIGILTFHNSDNYGAILQTLATQQKVKDLGYQPEIIDYVCANKKAMYRTVNLSFDNSIKQNIGGLIGVKNAPFKAQKKAILQKIVEKEYNLTSKTYYTSQDMKELNNDLSAFICGSDQIWNYMNTKFDQAYFLDFVEDSNKKISYAASFGISKLEKYQKEYTELLNDIAHLSVREQQGAQIVTELTNRDIPVVLDPTLILNEQEWRLFSQKGKQLVDEPYVLLYTLHNTPEIKNHAEKLANQLKCKVIKIATGTKDLVNKKALIPNPYEYVGLIDNAEYVVTDSFHGTVFSLNLKTNFYVYLKSDNKANSRIENILTKCDLINRIVMDEETLPNELRVDFTFANQALEKERKYSLDFLETALAAATK